MKREKSNMQLFGHKTTNLVLLFCLLILMPTLNLVNGQSTLYPLGAKLLSDSEYSKLPKVNWEALRSNSNKQSIATQSNGIVMLNNPPIGDQGTQGSCVGWAVGYAATSILAYPKFNNNWNEAKRSPNYIYNQIKIDPNDCESSTYTTTGLNILSNQGDCSWTLMPYNNTDCMTLPNNAQRFDAALNSVFWSALAPNNVASIKQALDLGYPVVIAFNVFQSFYDMWDNNGIWNSANSGTNYGGHATCIIGYDDTKQMFKVQNSWGTSGGDSGYFWVTYNLVQNYCLNEAYVLSHINQSVYPTFSGPSQICNQETYTINDLPTGAAVTWGSIPSGVVTFQPNKNSVIVTKNCLGSIICLTAQITVNGATCNLSKGNISVGQPLTITEESTLGLNYSSASDAYEIIAGSGNYKYSGKLVVNDYYGLATYYSWAKVTGSTTLPISWFASNNSVNVNSKVSGKMLILSCTASNSCGSFSKEFAFYTGLSPLFAIYPNPATTSLTVILNEEAETTTRSNTYDIQLWNSTSLVKIISTDQKSTQVSLNGLPRGIYYLHLIKNKEIIEKQILIVN